MHVGLIAASLDPRTVARAVMTRAAGGLVSFVGYARERGDDDRLVSALVYEAHEALVLDVLRAIGAEVAARFDAGLAIEHRVGTVVVGEPAVAIAAASAHRAAAFAACRYAIDELKGRAPIWKRECYVDGTSVWRANP